MHGQIQEVLTGVPNVNTLTEAWNKFSVFKNEKKKNSLLSRILTSYH